MNSIWWLISEIAPILPKPIANLEDKQYAARQIVVAIGHGAFLGHETKEMYPLVVVESWSSVQFLNLLVYQDFEPFFV
jgi:hypothetical protein